eukprot:759614-Prymnesium_polylepis.1
MHFEGKGSPQDLVEASRLYSLAAEQGGVRAKQALNQLADAAADQLLAEEEAENDAKTKPSKKSRKGKARAKPTPQAPPLPPQTHEPETDGEPQHSDGCEAAGAGSADVPGPA